MSQPEPAWWDNSDPREATVVKRDIVVCASEKGLFRAEVISKTIVLHDPRKGSLELIGKDDIWPPQWYWAFSPRGW